VPIKLIDKVNATPPLVKGNENNERDGSKRVQSEVLRQKDLIYVMSDCVFSIPRHNYGTIMPQEGVDGDA